MKLYTEEQVREAIDRAREGIRIYRVNEFETEKEFDFSEDSIINSLIPIEFPSAIEVDAKAEDVFREYPSRPKEHPELKYNRDINAPRKRKAFVMGSNWIINQIKQQSNGN